MSITICHHVKLGGGRCGSPAMRRRHYCYFHASAHRAIPSMNLWPSRRKSVTPQRYGEHGEELEFLKSYVPLRVSVVNSITLGGHSAPARPYELPPDSTAIQRGFTRVIWGVTQGLLNARQAKIILATLHQAMAGRTSDTATGAFAVTSNQLPSPNPQTFMSESRRG